jgi:hypothetical protein
MQRSPILAHAPLHYPCGEPRCGCPPPVCHSERSEEPGRAGGGTHSFSAPCTPAQCMRRAARRGVCHTRVLPSPPGAPNSRCHSLRCQLRGADAATWAGRYTRAAASAADRMQLDSSSTEPLRIQHSGRAAKGVRSIASAEVYHSTAGQHDRIRTHAGIASDASPKRHLSPPNAMRVFQE